MSLRTQTFWLETRPATSSAMPVTCATPSRRMREPAIASLSKSTSSPVPSVMNGPPTGRNNGA
ncbi:hypothetical protein BE08_21925 [Sorangium cellulosum]|uniref:Uncharacterized protein n=1 Tax=Sorangium cellulosum TaxID=56 RepID=A0A150NYC8_SORCE|nr:hypothetical protein BE08_21925 [Sorangium cellulosum]